MRKEKGKIEKKVQQQVVSLPTPTPTKPTIEIHFPLVPDPTNGIANILNSRVNLADPDERSQRIGSLSELEGSWRAGVPAP